MKQRIAPPNDKEITRKKKSKIKQKQALAQLGNSNEKDAVPNRNCWQKHKQESVFCGVELTDGDVAIRGT